ncbi:hypothetical protein CYMTET_53482, partial [Cymbomonas tetramitiformis]
MSGKAKRQDSLNRFTSSSPLVRNARDDALPALLFHSSFTPLLPQPGSSKGGGSKPGAPSDSQLPIRAQLPRRPYSALVHPTKPFTKTRHAPFSPSPSTSIPRTPPPLYETQSLPNIDYLGPGPHTEEVKVATTVLVKSAGENLDPYTSSLQSTIASAYPEHFSKVLPRKCSWEFKPDWKLLKGVSLDELREDWRGLCDTVGSRYVEGESQVLSPDVLLQQGLTPGVVKLLYHCVQVHTSGMGALLNTLFSLNNIPTNSHLLPATWRLVGSLWDHYSRAACSSEIVTLAAEHSQEAEARRALEEQLEAMADELALTSMKCSKMQAIVDDKRDNDRRQAHQLAEYKDSLVAAVRKGNFMERCLDGEVKSNRVLKEEVSATAVQLQEARATVEQLQNDGDPGLQEPDVGGNLATGERSTVMMRRTVNGAETDMLRAEVAELQACLEAAKESQQEALKGRDQARAAATSAISTAEALTLKLKETGMGKTLLLASNHKLREEVNQLQSTHDGAFEPLIEKRVAEAVHKAGVSWEERAEAAERAHAETLRHALASLEEQHRDALLQHLEMAASAAATAAATSEATAKAARAAHADALQSALNEHGLIKSKLDIEMEQLKRSVDEIRRGASNREAMLREDLESARASVKQKTSELAALQERHDDQLEALKARREADDARALSRPQFQQRMEQGDVQSQSDCDEDELKRQHQRAVQQMQAVATENSIKQQQDFRVSMDAMGACLESLECKIDQVERYCSKLSALQYQCFGKCTEDVDRFVTNVGFNVAKVESKAEEVERMSSEMLRNMSKQCENYDRDVARRIQQCVHPSWDPITAARTHKPTSSAVESGVKI